MGHPPQGGAGMTPRLRSGDPCWCGSGRKLKRCHGDHGAHRRPPVTPGCQAPVRTVAAGIARPSYVTGAVLDVSGGR